MKHVPFLLIITLLLAACSSTPETITETVQVEVTRIVENVTEIEVTRIIEVVQEIEVTRVVESIIVATPTEEPTPTPLPEGEGVIALNNVASVESGGVTVEIARVLIANKEAIEQDFSVDSSFDNVDIVAMLVFKVKNNSEQTVSIYPDQGNVQVNSELIDLIDFFLAGFGDDISGDLPPGVELIGGQWFGINRSTLDEINEMTLRFGGPSNPENFSKLGEDFEIVLDMSNKVFEPIPQELLDALQ